jgi:hypothetical protein
MDYKQRINDELNSLKGSIRKKMSQEAQNAERDLEMEKKVLSSLFEEELTGEEKVTSKAKR